MSRADGAVLDWVVDYWNRFSLWVQGLRRLIGSLSCDFATLRTRFRWRRYSWRWPSGWPLGSGLLSNTVLSGLRDDKKDLQHQIDTLTDGKNALNEKLKAAGEFDAQMAPRMVRDALKDKSVVVFRTPDAVDGDVDAAVAVRGAMRVAP